jgi:hypothetical protein
LIDVIFGTNNMQTNVMSMTTTAELVWLYVKQRPFLKESIIDGTVNYSALARRICLEAFGNTKKQNAVKMALVRMGRKIDTVQDSLEKRIVGVLKKSTITIKNKVAVVIAKREIDGIKPLSYARSGDHITYIIGQSEFDKIPKKLLWKAEENLNLMVVESPEDLEDVPGVIAHILSSLASEGINVVEFISCYTDTILVVKQADTARAYQILSEMC